MAEMVDLFVNGLEVTVEAGKNLIDALRAVGIEIPHFCYHPALGADGNCRMCLVLIEDGRPPLVPACKTPAVEGMKVRFDTEKIKKIRRDILELELLNHPADCPVCDQAGECSLQDYYMTYSRAESRRDVAQVEKAKKLDFGCGVIHDQQRCVLCTRCVRFTRQITKTGELGIVNRSDAACVTIFPGTPLDNRYALNIVDICPVGAMTSRDFRFKQRAWFLRTAPGICQGCSRGCNIFIDHHRGKNLDDMIYRFRARPNLLINGYFICDSGRLSYHFENENRQNRTVVDGMDVSFEDGIKATRARLDRAKRALMLVSPDCSLEQLFAVKRIAEQYGADVSGYSDAYILNGDGDDYLICDDKAANRKGLELLEINTEKARFSALLNDADLLVNFNNDLFFSAVNDEFRPRLNALETVAICSHTLPVYEHAAVILPTASFSEYGGMLINCETILQRFAKAVNKNNEPIDITGITGMLSGNAVDEQQIRLELGRSVPVLTGIDLDRLPDEGLKLQSSEETHVGP